MEGPSYQQIEVLKKELQKISMSVKAIAFVTSFYVIKEHGPIQIKEHLKHLTDLEASFKVA